MRSTSSQRLAVCRKVCSGAQPSKDDLLIAAAITLAESSERGLLLAEVKAIRERLDAVCLGNALIVTGPAF